jgi:hypothetical protein
MPRLELGEWFCVASMSFFLPKVEYAQTQAQIQIIYLKDYY